MLPGQAEPKFTRSNNGICLRHAGVAPAVIRTHLHNRRKIESTGLADGKRNTRTRRVPAIIVQHGLTGIVRFLGVSPFISTLCATPEGVDTVETFAALAVFLLATAISTHRTHRPVLWQVCTVR